MTPYPLQSVLELRRREEEAAAARLVNATRRRAEAETEEAQLLAAVENARQNLIGAQETLPSNGSPAQARSASAAPAFVARRSDEWTLARQRLATFRSGALTEARQEEDSAAAQHLARWRAREALEKHAAKHTSGMRAARERREEEILEEIAGAAGRHRGKREV